MELKTYFTRCEEKIPQSHMELQRTYFVLRRSGVDTMKVLREQAHKKLAELWDIGAKSFTSIREVYASYESVGDG